MSGVSWLVDTGNNPVSWLVGSAEASSAVFWLSGSGAAPYPWACGGLSWSESAPLSRAVRQSSLSLCAADGCSYVPEWSSGHQSSGLLILDLSKSAKPKQRKMIRLKILYHKYIFYNYKTSHFYIATTIRQVSPMPRISSDWSLPIKFISPLERDHLPFKTTFWEGPFREVPQ